MKRKLTLCALALSLLLLNGCGQPAQQQNIDYIGSEQAKSLALQDAGLSAEGVAFSDVALDQRGGLNYYQVAFSMQGQTYTYQIDALTGTVIESKVSAVDPVLENGGSAADQAMPIASAGMETDVSANSTASGASATASQPAASSSGNMISAEEAKSKALSHAGLTNDQVSFVKEKLDRDHGRQSYDVEFYTKDFKEYDYEIDAYTGEVISYDFDADSYAPSSAASGSSITADQAKQTALAQIPGATTSDIWEFETDYDDGRLVYEGKILYDNREYEFEIDGYSGAIRSWESDPIGR